MNTMKTIGLTAFLLASAIAFANPTTFEALDTDKNEVISEVEAQADENVAKLFKQLDVNEDGQLSKVEFEQLTQLGQGNE
jgi:predicted nucleotidyltransferase